MSCPSGLFEAYSAFGPSQHHQSSWLSIIQAHPHWTPGCETAYFFFFSGIQRTIIENSPHPFHTELCWEDAVNEYNTLLYRDKRFTVQDALDWIRRFTGSKKIWDLRPDHPASYWLSYPEFPSGTAPTQRDDEGLVVQRFRALTRAQKIGALEYECDRHRGGLCDGEYESDFTLTVLFHLYGIDHCDVGSDALSVTTSVINRTEFTKRTIGSDEWARLVHVLDSADHRHVVVP